jgi:hypothetical protein
LQPGIPKNTDIPEDKKLMKQQKQSQVGNIVFFEKDDPRAAQALREVIARTNLPVLGLVLKVREGTNGDEIVNWMYADDDYIKSLALILPEK